LKLSKELGDLKFEWRFSSLIGDYYLKNKDINEAVNYYNAAFKIVREMVFSVPEEYRIQYANASKAFEIYNKLIMTMKYNSKIEFETCKTITSMGQLNEIFNISL
jgi:hypothetical protein